MKSRHTEIKGKVARSFGVDKETAKDLVVELNAEEGIVIRLEPTDRRLKRGEVLPAVTIAPAVAFDNYNKAPEEVCSSAQEAESLIEKLCKKIPIAKFMDGAPQNIEYRAKVWLLSELNQIIKDER